MFESVFDTWKIRIIGAIFWNVAKIRPTGNVTPCITSGSQACNGANPIFIPNAIIVMWAREVCNGALIK